MDNKAAAAKLSKFNIAPLFSFAETCQESFCRGLVVRSESQPPWSGADFLTFASDGQDGCYALWTIEETKTTATLQAWPVVRLSADEAATGVVCMGEDEFLALLGLDLENLGIRILKDRSWAKEALREIKGQDPSPGAAAYKKWLSSELGLRAPKNVGNAEELTEVDERLPDIGEWLEEHGYR